MEMISILVLFSLLISASSLWSFAVREANLINDLVYVRLLNNGSHTEFNISLTLNTQKGITADNPKGVWLAVGFNDWPYMLNSQSIICQLYPKAFYVRQFYTASNNRPSILSAMPIHDLFETRVSVVNNKMHCSFTRVNELKPVLNYYQLKANSRPYLVSAFGVGVRANLHPTKSLAFHGANRDVTPDKINFELDPDEQLEKESGEAEKEPEA